MKKTIKIAGIIAAMMMSLSLSTTIFAADEDAADDQHRVVRVDIPNSDGTFTTLKGHEAQQWYDRVMQQSKQIAAEEQAFNNQNIVDCSFFRGTLIISLIILSLSILVILKKIIRKSIQ